MENLRNATLYIMAVGIRWSVRCPKHATPTNTGHGFEAGARLL